MAAGVSVDRFEREIHLAARLQHPHIVPLLTAGSAGDLLYYIMPHIEGESLRARLAHDRELPVGETVRIVRDVADALAYAHAHGIVHRDVKPDNVLLSGKHALVTDFGVAKAVADSTGKTALTSMGVALGTPAYMAPEQAAADPHTDHRADLYAVGTLAYEMLTGRPPFTGTSPQAVLAAQVNQPPEPVTSHRAAVPPALAALVMRCLEKKPADRLQTAEELLGQLEAMATPSGGMTPTGATPVISSGTEAAIRRAHPIRVAAFFTAASVGVLTVVYWLVRGLGLPDWVLPAAVGLLLAGLPIMVVTGLVERRRAIASTARIPAPTGVARGLHRWLTWRRALMGGVSVFAGLGVVTGVYMAMRLLGIGPAGTLVASGVIKDREPLILANFDNRASDSTLGLSLTEAFRVDLSQSPMVKLVDAQTLRDALGRMQRPPGAPLDLGLAREVAEREGVKAVVTGQIDPVGRGYVLSASLVSAADGRLLRRCGRRRRTTAR
jgi:TolB-like protein